MRYITLLLIFSLSLLTNAQEETLGPSSIITGRFVKRTIPLRDMPRANFKTDEKTELRIVPNNLRANEKLVDDAFPIDGEQNAQTTFGTSSSNGIEENFEGSNRNQAGGVPPDPTGAVGPNHYVHAVNFVVNIFDKMGNSLAGPVTLKDFLDTSNSYGDPIVLYDQLEDRWMVSQFSFLNRLIVGVSETADPTGSYLVYEFLLDSFPDYPHYAVWNDGYYLTANKFVGNTTYVIEKEGLYDPDNLNPVIIGFDLPGVVNNPNTVFSPEPANLTGTTFPVEGAPGYIVYLQDDGWSETIEFDHLKVWEIEADFDVPSQSTISTPLTLPVNPFDVVFLPFGTGDVNQPGTNQRIDIIGGIIAYAANYRSFEDYNSWLVTFSVDVDGNNTSGIRWVELRNTDTEEWTVFQEGTYAPDDGNSRFMGSAGMDAAGNIGLGFNIAGPDLMPSIRYTGRFANDEEGLMTVEETSIIEGNGIQTINHRFGDYSHLTVDVNDFTFWHTAQYFQSDNIWATRIASFSLSGGFLNDVGVSAILSPSDDVLGVNEFVEVEVRNFGLEAQTDIPLELIVDGVLVASELLSGTLMPNEAANYTFTHTLDLLSSPGTSFEIGVRTVLLGDDFESNNELQINVLNLSPDDIGIVEILSPISASSLGQEEVTITIANFGGESQSVFDVSYSINDDISIIETVVASIAPGETIDYTFEQLADLSLSGTYNIEASTLLSNDGDSSNNGLEATVINLQCLSSINDTDFPVGPNIDVVAESIIVIDSQTIVNDVNVIINVDHSRVEDLEIFIIGPNGTEIELSTDNGGFNSNYTNTVFDDEADISIFDGTAPFTGSFKAEGLLSDFDGLIANGTWILQIRDDLNTQGGILLDWTLEICGDGILSVDNVLAQDDEFKVFDTGNNQFQLSLQTNTITERLTLDVYNLQGQSVQRRRINSENGGYNFLLDLSHLRSGVYIVRLGNTSVGRVQKIIVR